MQSSLFCYFLATNRHQLKKKLATKYKNTLYGNKLFENQNNKQTNVYVYTL